MTKTRMLKDDRAAICAAILDHKFKPITEALGADAAALAHEAWVKLYDAKTRAWMETAPEGALPDKSGITVNAAGYLVVLTFSAIHRVLHKDYYDRVNITDADLSDRIRDFLTRSEQARNDRSALRAKIAATIEGFRTFDDLVEAWPEAEPLITPRWKSRPEYAAKVPAVLLKDLSEALGLPPDLAEAA